MNFTIQAKLAKYWSTIFKQADTVFTFGYISNEMISKIYKKLSIFRNNLKCCLPSSSHIKIIVTRVVPH